jgi:2-polyprenyl-3-methyl-5-hydroxy-6-metoxy-1,4-benzoquinol methylase
MPRIHYTHCPVCGSSSLSSILKAKDHTVSQESFAIVQCDTCSLRFTQDVPDQASITPYYKSENYISHTDTAKGLVNRLYHAIRKRTLTRKRKLIQQATGLSGGVLLDIGSGTGSFLNEMNQAGWKATGLEPDPDARSMAKQLYGVDLLDIPALYAQAADSFDAITLWHVLEHVHDLQAFIAQLKKLVKKSGKIFIAVPNYNATDAKVYQEYWAAYDVPRHLYHFSPQSMKVLLEKHGLKVSGYQPMWYDSFYISILSSKYKNGTTNWPGAVFTGLKSNWNALGDTKKCSSVIYIIAHS